MKKILIGIFSLLFVFSLYSEVFRFKHTPNSKQKIEAFINGKQLQANRVIAEYTQQYKTIRSVKSVENNTALFEDVYYFYNKNTLASKQILELRNDDVTFYKRDPYGKISMSSYSVFPTLRNVPCFPEQDIRPNDRWIIPGLEVQDLFADKTLSIFPVNVAYTFLGYDKINNIDVAKISYEYEVKVINNGQKDIDKRIRQVSGKSVTIMYFDNNRGTRVKEEYKRDYAFLISNNNQEFVVQFIDNGERYWYEIELMNKDKIAQDLKNDVEKDKIEDIEIKRDEKGVKISIENIHFKPDSTELVSDDILRVDKIANILRKYKDKGVLIIGHTTDKGTALGRQKLSLERAKTIADFLIKKDAINPQKSSYGGKGDSEPVADNSTQEGMKKNRRVEIYILEE